MPAIQRDETQKTLLDHYPVLMPPLPFNVKHVDMVTRSTPH